MIQDNRDGAYNLTYNRVLIDPVSIVNDLLTDCKASLYITDSNFDDKLVLLIKEAIFDYERMTATSVIGQTINLRYEYFSGKNKMPFPPHNSITVPADFTSEGLTVKYVTGGTGEPLEVELDAGFTVLPADIKQVLIKMVDCKFKHETNAKDYPSALFSEIKSYSQHID